MKYLEQSVCRDSTNISQVQPIKHAFHYLWILHNSFFGFSHVFKSLTDVQLRSNLIEYKLHCSYVAHPVRHAF